MTIPRKGRRTISVDDVDYHYKVSFARSERIVIRRSDGAGKCLFLLPFAIMKPAHIATAIRFARFHGWQSDTDRLPCWLVGDLDSNGTPVFERLDNADFRVVSFTTNGKLPQNVDLSRFTDTRPWYQRKRPGKRDA